MMSGSRKNRPSGLFTCLLLLSAAAFAAGCTTSNTSGGGGQPVNHLEPSGNSVPGWVVPTGGSLHAGAATNEYISGESPSSCSSCHGSDLSGGISKVSCFGNTAGCHHGTIPGWVATPPAAQPHGNSAKTAPGDGSFFSCQICHGADFRTIRGGTTCFSCHSRSPHAPKPWIPTAGSPYDHGSTNSGNAPVCYQCHAYTGTPNPNNPHVPPTPAPPGTAPGCFNGTMCHNQLGHPAGWVATPPAAQPHGITAKKDGTVAGQGFPSCETCHGSNFTGSAIAPTCLNTAACHGTGVASPHAPKPWRGTPYTHADTVAAGNAPVCYKCHAYMVPQNPNNPHQPTVPAPPGTSPGCFNGTMCHNQIHPAGWFTNPPAAQPHGVTAKKNGTVPGQGFPSCQTCHGTNFAGGSSKVSCFPCHSPPHAPKPWIGSPYTHTDTVEAGNAPVCYTCHAYTGTPNPNNPHVPPTPAPPGTAPGCFNGTMCHNAGHAVPFNSASHYSVTTATFPGSCSPCHDVSAPSTKAGPVCQTCHAAGNPVASPPLASCTSCHANPPNGGAGAAYANIAGAHAVHIALNSAGTPVSCDTCHNGLGTGTLNHYNRAKSRVPPGDVFFNSSYLAQTGTRSFDNVSASLTYLTCNAVSCHGGQATPNWQTGVLDVNTQCTSCHTFGTAQYNGPTSTNHNRTQHRNAACIACHNTTALAVNHFTNLGTPTLEGPASATIGGSGTVISSWNPATKSCTPVCHGNETW